MTVTQHLGRYFVWYILGIVIILLGIYYRSNPDIFNVSLKNYFDQAFYNGETELQNEGPAPELTGIFTWLNSEALTLESLRGKVVLIDFWTYSCINCIRTFPYVTEWYEKYKNDGFVIIGVHTPEFAFEKEISNVEKAIKKYGITYPVALDNDFATWRAYENQYWPAHYLINQEGEIVYTHFGEGNYEITENAIRSLLKKDMMTEKIVTEPVQAQTPEIYFGSSRLEYLSKLKKLPTNHFALDGDWKLFSEYAQLNSAGSIRLNYNAAKVHMVAEADADIIAEVYMDNKLIKTITIKDSSLYTLVEEEKAQRRVIEIKFPQGGVRAFTFTFG